jgi:23S rRNA (cytidine1920-2'-O)/16S rRNA (cytidine1409-2'-O)-methyltransferase
MTAFDLGARVRGREAIDVGASHGGFTECMLAYGALRVTAIDVGHDQMREPLRSDPRVALLEGCHFKTLPLRIAPGPFGFFAIDVSFVAARTMMRPLALRLRAGAHGVVLLKPQFELPKQLVPPGGVVTNPGLRSNALARFLPKAGKLGYELIQRMDCPVAGGDGNVEYLLHLRFDGLPDRADDPDEP